MQQAFYKPNVSFSLINLEISKTQKVKDTSKNDAIFLQAECKFQFN